VYVPSIELHEPATLAEAAALLARHAPDARLMAGGTDVLVDLKTGRIEVAHLISIGGIEALRGITETADGLRIGALATVAELGRSPGLAGEYAALRDAVERMAAPQIRNAATVGGNLAGAVPCADLPPVLMTLNASVLLWSPAGEREVAVRDLFVGPRETLIGPDEVLMTVVVPHPPAGFGAAYARFSQRDGNAIAVAAVAAGLTLDGRGIVTDAGIALGAVAPTPKWAAEAGALLVGRNLDESALHDAARAAMASAQPISDVRGTAGHRRDLVGILTRRALAAAARRAGRT
jgi:carbon-monoxide dehydrogenase medium subunit